MADQNNDAPDFLQDNGINAANHLIAIANHGLGPQDPTQSNEQFWQDKGDKWGVTSGDARCRLCANCEHYKNTSEVQDWIDNGPAKNIKASDLPLDPKWVDIESKPVAICTLYDITCSPVRTCDSQELGGPIDDIKEAALELADAITNSGIDVKEVLEKKYSKDNPPQWASKKSAKVREVAIRVFNETYASTGSESKARIASLAAMTNAEKAEKKKTQKSVRVILANKYEDK